MSASGCALGVIHAWCCGQRLYTFSFLSRPRTFRSSHDHILLAQKPRWLPTAGHYRTRLQCVWQLLLDRSLERVPVCCGRKGMLPERPLSGSREVSTNFSRLPTENRVAIDPAWKSQHRRLRLRGPSSCWACPAGARHVFRLVWIISALLLLPSSCTSSAFVARRRLERRPSY